MTIKIKKYKDQLEEWPKTGHKIMAQFDDEKIIVYQSYNKGIGDFAVENQCFGGPFKMERMTWIKPNFLWMMYRNGWGTKKDQEVVLAIHLKREAFERYLTKAVHSSHVEALYGTYEEWKEKIAASSVRLQWDPDHDPNGQKIERRAIQIGLREEEVKRFAKEDILKIEDISAFVEEQRQLVEKRKIEELYIPEEKSFRFQNEALNEKLNLK